MRNGIKKGTIIKINYSHDDKWVVHIAYGPGIDLYQYLQKDKVDTCIDYLLKNNRKLEEYMEYQFPQLCKKGG